MTNRLIEYNFFSELQYMKVDDLVRLIHELAVDYKLLYESLFDFTKKVLYKDSFKMVSSKEFLESLFISLVYSTIRNKILTHDQERFVDQIESVTKKMQLSMDNIKLLSRYSDQYFELISEHSIE